MPSLTESPSSSAPEASAGRTSTARAFFASILVIGGCQANAMALELVVRHPYGKHFGSTLTFLQFFTVSVLGGLLLLQRSNGTTATVTASTSPSFAGVALRPRVLNFRLKIALACLFYMVSVANNEVFRFRISVPLHTVVRSSSLVTAMLTGVFVSGKRYTWQQIGCAVLVSGGVAMLTLASAGSESGSASSSSAAAGQPTGDVWWWYLGVAVIVGTTVLSAGLGVLQDHLYVEARNRLPKPLHGELWREALFSSHAYALPLFIVGDAIKLWCVLPGGEDERSLVDSLRGIPDDLWVPILVNVLSQFVCIRGVYALTAATSSVTMTMTITLRKFISVVVSLVYFGHLARFGALHLAAVLATLVGASVYPFLPSAKPKPKQLKSD